MSAAAPARAPRITLVGAGGLGGPIAHALASAGAELRIFDGDVVEPPNLHRQLQFALGDVGRPKASTLARRLRDRTGQTCTTGPTGLASGPEIRPLNGSAIGLDHRWTAGAADREGADCDLILDGSDDPATKFAVADWAARTGRPSVIAGALGLGGNVFLGAPGHACFRCLFEEPPEEAPTCADAGVLGPVVASIAGLAALAALELVAGRYEHAGTIWILEDALAGGPPRRVAVTPRPGCPSCAAAPRPAGSAAGPGGRTDGEGAWPRC